MKSRKNFRLLFPKLQGRFLMLMLLCSAASVVLSTCLTVMALSKLSGNLPHDGNLVLRELPSLIGFQLVVGFAMAVPAFALIGALASMPMFGALFRVHSYLRDVEAGSETEELSLRDDDPLQEMAAMVSRMTGTQRADNASKGEALVAKQLELEESEESVESKVA